MSTSLLSFSAGAGATLVLAALAFWFWQRRRAAAEPEVRDAPLPAVTGTADPFAQHWSQRLLDIIEWKRYEEVVAAYIRHLGFETKSAGLGADGVLAMQGFDPGNPQPTMLIQCKAWNRERVDDAAVRALHGRMTATRIGQGAFFNTGGLTPAAVSFASDKNIDLVSGRELLDRLGHLPLATQSELLELATEGDYATPTCPDCAVKMVRRVTVSGAQAGVYFWGCAHHPGCRRTFPVRQG